MIILKRSLWIFTLLAAILLLHGCATIFGGRTNCMVFTGAPGVTAEVFIDDTLVGQAPGKIIIPKNVIQHGSMLEIRTEGEDNQEYVIIRKPHAGYIVADFIVGGIPLIFDAASGNLYRPYPRKFDLNVDKPE